MAIRHPASDRDAARKADRVKVKYERMSHQAKQLASMQSHTPGPEMPPVPQNPRSMDNDTLMEWIRVELAQRTQSIDPKALERLGNEIGQLAWDVARYSKG